MGFVLHGVEWMKQLSKLARFKTSDISKTLRPIIKIACMAHFLLCAMGFILLQKNMYSALAAVFLFTPLVVAMGAVATALMKLNTYEKKEFFGYLFPIEIPRMSSGKPFGMGAIYLWFILWNLMCLGVYFELLPLARVTIADYLAAFVASFVQLGFAVVVCFHLVYVFFYQSDM